MARACSKWKKGAFQKNFKAKCPSSSNPTPSPFESSPTPTPQPPPSSSQFRHPPWSAPILATTAPILRHPLTWHQLTKSPSTHPNDLLPLHWFPALHLPPDRARLNAQLKGAAQEEGREEQCSGREAFSCRHHRCYFVRAHPAARLTDGHEAQGVVLPQLPAHPILWHQVTSRLCFSPCLVDPLGPGLICCRWGWDLPLLLLLTWG